MKIAITVNGDDLAAPVSDKPGTASHLLVIDLSSRELQAFKGSGKPGPGTGFQFIAMAVNEECTAFLTGWVNPVGERQLEARGIKVVTGVTGKAAEAIDQFQREYAPDLAVPREKAAEALFHLDSHALAKACRQALRQISGMLPVIAGVVFLTGLVTAFIPQHALVGFFSGGLLHGIFKGALAGSLFTGNPANSYIIGEKLLDQGIGIGVVTALICAWVTVGIVQLPAEITALGRRFAVARNVLCFMLSMVIALVMASVFGTPEG